MVLGKARGPEPAAYCVDYGVSEKLVELYNETFAGKSIGDQVPRELVISLIARVDEIAEGSCGYSEDLVYTASDVDSAANYPFLEGLSYSFKPGPEGDFEDCLSSGDPDTGRCMAAIVPGNHVAAILSVEGTNRVIFVQTELQIVDPKTGRIFGRTE